MGDIETAFRRRLEERFKHLGCRELDEFIKEHPDYYEEFEDVGCQLQIPTEFECKRPAESCKGECPLYPPLIIKWEGTEGGN